MAGNLATDPDTRILLHLHKCADSRVVADFAPIQVNAFAKPDIAAKPYIWRNKLIVIHLIEAPICTLVL
jgi:hypothetical protein